MVEIYLLFINRNDKRLKTLKKYNKFIISGWNIFVHVLNVRSSVDWAFHWRIPDKLSDDYEDEEDDDDYEDDEQVTEENYEGLTAFFK